MQGHNLPIQKQRKEPVAKPADERRQSFQEENQRKNLLTSAKVITAFIGVLPKTLRSRVALCQAPLRGTKSHDSASKGFASRAASLEAGSP
jgi:hypothetical protein